MNDWGPRLAIVFLALAAQLAAPGTSGPQPATSKPSGRAEQGSLSCGEHALFMLLTLEGRSLPDSLISAGEATEPAQSMSRLRELGRKANLALAGLRLRSAHSIDRPMILYLNRSGHGHYVTVRPVGPAGRLVQVIDSDGFVSVIDRNDLFASPDWTGLALAPEPHSLQSLAGFSLLGLSGLLALVGWRIRGRRSLPARAGD